MSPILIAVCLSLTSTLDEGKGIDFFGAREKKSTRALQDKATPETPFSRQADDHLCGVALKRRGA